MLTSALTYPERLPSSCDASVYSNSHRESRVTNEISCIPKGNPYKYLTVTLKATVNRCLDKTSHFTEISLKYEVETCKSSILVNVLG